MKNLDKKLSWQISALAWVGLAVWGMWFSIWIEPSRWGFMFGVLYCGFICMHGFVDVFLKFNEVDSDD